MWNVPVEIRQCAVVIRGQATLIYRFTQSKHGTGGLTMDEYIKREALVHRLKSPYLFNITPRIFEIISEIPAADVAPVVHGRWDDSGRYTFPGGSTAVRCTNCGCALTESEYHLNNWNYCPVCGAKMDGVV